MGILHPMAAKLTEATHIMFAATLVHTKGCNNMFLKGSHKDCLVCGSYKQVIQCPVAESDPFMDALVACCIATLPRSLSSQELHVHTRVASGSSSRCGDFSHPIKDTDVCHLLHLNWSSCILFEFNDQQFCSYWPATWVHVRLDAYLSWGVCSMELTLNTTCFAQQVGE